MTGDWQESTPVSAATARIEISWKLPFATAMLLGLAGLTAVSPLSSQRKVRLNGWDEGAKQTKSTP